jgi:hypothetical protein
LMQNIFYYYKELMNIINCQISNKLIMLFCALQNMKIKMSHLKYLAQMPFI